MALDNEREAFRECLEQEGIIQALTQAIAKVYSLKEIPEDTMGAIKEELSKIYHASTEMKLRMLREERDFLEKHVKELREKLKDEKQRKRHNSD